MLDTKNSMKYPLAVIAKADQSRVTSFLWGFGTGSGIHRIHLGNQVHLLPGDGMFEGQTVGAEKLAWQAHLAFLAAVLGIAQNGEAAVGAVDPELVGSAGNGPQGEFT